MKKLTALLFSLALFVGLSAPIQAVAQDQRLLGTWAVTNLPGSITLPAEATLTISTFSNGAFLAVLTNTVTFPAPVNCTGAAGDVLITLTPLGGINYSAKYSFYVPFAACALLELSTKTGTIEFAEDNNSFASCDSGQSCVNWTRVGGGTSPTPTPIASATPTSTPAPQIGKTTVPPQVSAVGGKKSISVTFQSIVGAYAYRVAIAGPLNLARTVKTGNFTKFKELTAGKYNVTYSGFFKDSKNKVQSTKSSLKVKVTVTK